MNICMYIYMHIIIKYENIQCDDDTTMTIRRRVEVDGDATVTSNHPIIGYSGLMCTCEKKYEYTLCYIRIRTRRL